MEQDVLNAIDALKKDGCTCVLCRGSVILTSHSRGVKPLLDWLESDIGKDFSAADKVVGRAAAYLYCLLGIHGLYAQVISRPALGVLEEYGIPTRYDCLVEGIRNRTGDGPCPMETATIGVNSPEQALAHDSGNTGKTAQGLTASPKSSIILLISYDSS